MRPYLELVGGASNVCLAAKSVECTVSTFPLDNLTRVSTAVHSTKNLLSNHFLTSQLHSGASYSFIACI